MRGTQLGNYRVEDLLGEGGMGVVYVGRHDKLGHRVVVKVLQRELSSHAEMVQRFFNEARAATAIRNPGIVQVFDFGTMPDGRAYFVMELLEGETLTARLKRRRRDYQECCRLGRQVANVLQAAHDAGITHRDLKPDNLFLVPDSEVVGGERVKVLDFGIAKLAGASRGAAVKTHAGLFMGTPDYMSPEQCRSASNADARSDVYSLGCILFEMACLQPVFGTRSMGDMVAAHLIEPPPSPQALCPDMPHALSSLITSMLAKQPSARPQAMSVVSLALDQILRELDGELRGPLTPPRAFDATQPMMPLLRSTPMPSAMGTPVLATSPLSESAPGWPAAPLSSSGPHVAPGAQPLLHPVSLPSPPQLRTPPRFPIVLGGLALVGAAMAIVFARSREPSPEPAYSTPYVADAAAPAAEPVAAPPVKPVVVLVAEPAAAPVAEPVAVPAAAQAVEHDQCEQHVVARKWVELARCAEKLAPVDATRAAELAKRAVEEARSAPRISTAHTALQAGDVRRAKLELDQVWPESVDYKKLKQAYRLAESHAIEALVIQLDRATHADCQEYQQVLAKARAASPARVVAEAIRQSPCVARPACNADELEAKALQRYRVNDYAAALASFEAAYACKPSPSFLQRSLFVSCSLHDLAKARSYWKRLSPALRSKALAACVRNGITEKMLNAP